MFSPSDYNDAVPQFSNGNYANEPLNPLYVEEPDSVNYKIGKLNVLNDTVFHAS